MTLKEEIADGIQAEQLLSNPVYRKSLDKVKNGVIQAMSESPMGDEKTHNRLVIALQLLSQIEKQIKEVAETGQLARLQLEQTPVQKLKRAVGIR